MLNPEARHEALTRLNWLASDQPEERAHLLRLFEAGFNRLFVVAVDVAIESGDPIGQVLADHLSRHGDPGTAEKILGYLERNDLDEALPLRELLLVATAAVLEHRVATWPEPRSAAQREELATLHHKLGLRRRALGRWTEALENLTQAVHLRRALIDDGAHHLRPHLAISLDGLSTVLSDLQQREEAYETSREAIQLLRQESLTEPRLRSELAKALYTTSAAAADLQHHEEARAAAAESVEIYQELIQRGTVRLRGELAKSLINLGVAQAAVGRLDSSLATHRRAVSLLEDLAAERPERYTVDLSLALYGLGNRLGAIEDHEGAFRAMERAVAIRRELARHRPDAFRAGTFRGLYNLGNRLARMGRGEEAVQVTREAVEGLRGQAADQPAIYEPLLAEALNNLGNRLAALGELTESVDVTQEAIDIRRKLAEADPATYEPELALSLNNLGNKLGSLGYHERALDAADEAIEIFRRVVADNPIYKPNLATSLVNLGRHLRFLGRHREAIDALTEAVRSWNALIATTGTGFRENLAAAYFNLSRALRDGGDLREAIEAQRHSVEIYRDLAKRHGAFRVDWTKGLTSLGSLLTEAGRPDRAQPILEEALRLARQLDVVEGDDSSRELLADALQDSGSALFRLGRYEEALERSSEAVSTLRPVAARNPIEHYPALVRTLGNHALNLGRVGRNAEAVEVLREVVSLESPLPTPRSPDARLVHGMCLRDLGELLRIEGAVEEALDWAQRAVHEHEDLARDFASPVFRRQLALSHQAHCAVLSALDRDDEALVAARQTVQILSSLLDDRSREDESLDVDLAIAWRNLGSSLVNVGKLEEGCQALVEACSRHRELAERVPDMHRPELARSLRELAIGRGRLGDHEGALAELAEAVAIARELVARERSYVPLLAESVRSLAVELFHLERFEDALEPSRESLELDLQQALRYGSPKMGNLVRSLSNRLGILQAQGRTRDAVQTFEEILRALAGSEVASDLSLWRAELADQYKSFCSRTGHGVDRADS